MSNKPSTELDRYERIAALEAEVARLKEEVSRAIGTVEFMDPPDGGDVPLGEQVRRMREELDRLSAALRRAYRKSEVLDEPCFVTLGWAHAVCEGDPDFDTITKAFERESK